MAFHHIIYAMAFHHIYKEKSLDHEIKVTLTCIYFEVSHHSHGTNIQGMTILLSNSHRAISHNHWTMKYGSQ